ncbi:hypothetical protein VTK26DRAFT_9282 [Humicola hyalothermophila]
MPAVPPLSLNHFVGRTATTNFSVPSANTTAPLEVICAWPVSGQYGPGSRILYYVLVAACLLARKTEWLKNACLAAALIFPAVAALHGIVLAALHAEDAVDMDIYGALQFCSIGILTAPISVRLSTTYFNNPGRNTIFLWTIIVLAGLLALTVEFFRIAPTPCIDDRSGQPIYRASDFHYGVTTCGMVCSVELGPFSSMRDGSADNIYVVPRPRVFTFGAATLVSAACCIPAILSMVSTWDKIVRINWKKRFGDLDADEVIEGTNGATVGKMKRVNAKIREFLSVVEVPLFGGAVLTIIIVGEMNFWSAPVNYQTEPITNIGQWAPIVASVLAAGGSLYMLLEKGSTQTETFDFASGCCTCPCHEAANLRPGSQSDVAETVRRSSTVDAALCRRVTSPTHNILTPIHSSSHSDEEAIMHSDTSQGLGLHTVETTSTHQGNRPEVARILSNIAHKLGTASPDRFDDYEFKHGPATAFPQIPGEGNRNPNLIQIEKQWGVPNPDADDALTPRGRRSRANSFNGSISGSVGISRSNSPQPPLKSKPGPATSLLGLPLSDSPKSSSESAFPPRRQPAEQPEPEKSETEKPESEKPKPRATVVTLHSGEGSPAIVLSVEDVPAQAEGSTSRDVSSDSAAKMPP